MTIKSFALPQNLPDHIQSLCDAGKARLLSKLATLTLYDIESNDRELEDVLGVFYSLLSTDATDAMEDDAQKIGPITAAYASDLAQNKDLFAAVKKLYDARGNLPQAEQAALEKHYISFKRNGIDLPQDAQDRLREIDARLSQLAPQFAETVRKSGKAFTLHITDKNDLAGLPDTALMAAAGEAKSRGLDGHVFTLDPPSYIPFATYADNRDLREKLWRAFARRGMDAPHTTTDLIKEIVTLRHARAKLLGYADYASYALERRMAKTPQTVRDFTQRMVKAGEKSARAQLAELQEFAKIPELKPWDVAYYAEKLQHHKFGFDTETLRPYFPVQAVLDGVFDHIQTLFGLTFKLLPDAPKYHPDVTVYAVSDETGAARGTLYMDPFPRDSKKPGAWQGSLRDRRKTDTGVDLPAVVVVCNFTKPQGDTPALLTFDEVETLFHEFGHACHSLLTTIDWGSVGGTSVFWDFVELPSQIMENWLYETETLNRFARHYQTGAPIPADLIAALQASRTHMAGWQLWRQLQFGLLDMAWHTTDPAQISDVLAFEQKILGDMMLLPYEDGCSSTGFSHIFAGGYAAGYYSYLWAEVLDADAFSMFKETGLYNQDTGRKFRDTVLAKGGSEPPEDLFRAFRGRDVDVQALLTRRGLV